MIDRLSTEAETLDAVREGAKQEDRLIERERELNDDMQRKEHAAEIARAVYEAFMAEEFIPQVWDAKEPS
jgi:hypothetical protein